MATQLQTAHIPNRPSLSSLQTDEETRPRHSRTPSASSSITSASDDEEPPEDTPRAPPGALRSDMLEKSASESGHGEGTGLVSWVRSFVTLQPIKEGVIAGVSSVTEFGRAKPSSTQRGPGQQHRRTSSANTPPSNGRQLLEGSDASPAVVLSSPGSPLAYNQRLMLGSSNRAGATDAESEGFSFSSIPGFGTVSSAIGSIGSALPKLSSLTPDTGRRKTSATGSGRQMEEADDRKSMNLEIDQVTGEGTGSTGGGGEEVFMTPMPSPQPLTPGLHRFTSISDATQTHASPAGRTSSSPGQENGRVSSSITHLSPEIIPSRFPSSAPPQPSKSTTAPGSTTNLTPSEDQESSRTRRVSAPAPSLSQLAAKIPAASANLGLTPVSQRPASMASSGNDSMPNLANKSPAAAQKKGFFSRMGNKSSSSSFEPTKLNRTSTQTSQTKSVGSKDDKVRYIKTWSKNKSKKDFDRLFLAQELNIMSLPNINAPPSIYRQPSSDSLASNNPSTSGHGRVQSEVGHTGRGRSESHPARTQRSEPGHGPASAVPISESGHGHGARANTASSSKGTSVNGSARGPSVKTGKAIWAMKFSLDGRFLATAGHDGVVRIYEVLSDPAERDESLVDPHTGKSNVMPIFHPIPVLSFADHTQDVLDLAWSKNNFLLSSSMDKTVRLYHVTKNTCLATFLHRDFVTSIAFHPRDDRFFISGSLDAKLRLWNIPEKKVHLWTEIPGLITCVNFTNDGSLACVGTFTGECMLFESDSLKLNTSIMAKNAKKGDKGNKSKKEEKGRKITHIAPADGNRILITSNDSKHRLYSLADKSLEEKYEGHTLTSAQIKATFSDGASFVISGSEDKWVYLWESKIGDSRSWNFKKRDKSSYEAFPAYSNITTCAIFAPHRTYQHLAKAGDPRFAPSSRSSKLPAPGEAATAEDAIIVIADDQTGIIRVLRNSLVYNTS
ncbi:WD40 repeat-like protein [Atractiella rhizophila]|nr:WD40 repeat-like protein [Atractiella rhizophila]